MIEALCVVLVLLVFVSLESMHGVICANVSIEFLRVVTYKTNIRVPIQM